MALIRPRLSEYHGLSLTQALVPFAIPFLNEDLPLYVDPFLLWKSPSQQDYALHSSMMHSFNRLGASARRGNHDEAARLLMALSECDEVGLGSSAVRSGKRIGRKTADEILELFSRVRHYTSEGMAHIEETQLLVNGISKDRISDFTCNLVKSFLIDFTIDECERFGIPTSDVVVPEVYHSRKHVLENVPAKLPVHPETGRALLLVPRAVQRCWIGRVESAPPHLRCEVRRLIARGIPKPANV